MDSEASGALMDSEDTVEDSGFVDSEVTITSDVSEGFWLTSGWLDSEVMSVASEVEWNLGPSAPQMFLFVVVDADRMFGAFVALPWGGAKRDSWLNPCAGFAANVEEVCLRPEKVQFFIVIVV